MGKLQALMKRKVAGIPVLYLALAAVILFAAYAWKTGTIAGPGDDVAADADSTGDEAGGDATGNSQPTFTANPSSPVVTPDESITDPVVVDDNDKWRKRSVAWLIAGGYATAGNADNAISKYLNGETLSYDEGKLRDAAIKQYGLPPEPPAGAPTAAKPATRQFTHFPGVHTIQGASDNSYTELTQLYYGRTDSEAVDLLQSKNPSLGHAGPWPVGTKVNIPAYTPPKYYKATAARRTAAQLASANGISQGTLADLNDGMKFPVKVGTRVRVA